MYSVAFSLFVDYSSIIVLLLCDRQSGLRFEPLNLSGAIASSHRSLLGNYEIGRLLGEGSFGLVYEATPVGSDKRVALKQITKLGVRREEILQGGV